MNICNKTVKTIKILDAIQLISKVVSEIKMMTVINCYAKAEFTGGQEVIELDDGN